MFSLQNASLSDRDPFQGQKYWRSRIEDILLLQSLFVNPDCAVWNE